MKIEIYNEKLTPREDGPSIVSFVTEAGEELTRVHFEWIKDPEIPIIRIDLRDDYNANRAIGKSLGFGDVRKWLESYSDDVENKIAHIIFKNNSIDVLFDDKAIFCAFKMTFDETDRITFEDSF